MAGSRWHRVGPGRGERPLTRPFAVAVLASVTVLAAAALTACLSSPRTPGHTFDSMPSTCDELTRELRNAMFETSHVSDPDAEVATSASGETRLLRCIGSGDHPDLLTYVRSFSIGVVQVAREVETIRGVPVEEWLRDQADHPDPCVEPKQIAIKGAATPATVCLSIEHGLYVNASASVVETDARAQVGVSVEMARDTHDLGVSDLEDAATEVALDALAIVVAQMGTA